MPVWLESFLLFRLSEEFVDSSTGSINRAPGLRGFQARWSASDECEVRCLNEIKQQLRDIGAEQRSYLEGPLSSGETFNAIACNAS
jgi:hypothetical protein